MTNRSLMRRFFVTVVVLLVCVFCCAFESKEINADSISLGINTRFEQVHYFYNASNFVSGTEVLECSNLENPHRVVVERGLLKLDAGTEYEIAYSIKSCTIALGKVFADRGEEKVYHLCCSEIVDGVKSRYTSNITIQIVNDGIDTKTIVSVPVYNEEGVLLQNYILTD